MKPITCCRWNSAPGYAPLKEGGTRAVVYVEQFRDLNGVPYKTDIGLGYIDAQRQMSYSQFQRFLGSDDPLAHPYRELQSSLNIRQYDREILMDLPLPTTVMPMRN